jgi:hypothetical protein
MSFCKAGRGDWHSPVIPALGEWRQENFEFKSNLGCIVRSCLKKKRIIEEKKRLSDLWVNFSSSISCWVRLDKLTSCHGPHFFTH